MAGKIKVGGFTANITAIVGSKGTGKTTFLKKQVVH